MAIGFRKRVKIAPGVNLNFSKKGVSATIGGKGASINVGKKGVYANASIPGTGIYSRNKIVGRSGNSKKKSKDDTLDESLQMPFALFLVAIIIVVFLVAIFCFN